MPEARKPSGLEKVSTVLAPTLSTLIFIMIARELGADALGSVALFLSLGACLGLGFDLSPTWTAGGGRAARGRLHITFAVIGLVVALIGWFPPTLPDITALGLFVFYHGSTSAAIALSDGRKASAAGFADSATRLTLLVVLLTMSFNDYLPWIAACFAIGGSVALASVLGRAEPLGLSKAGAEWKAASAPALAFAVTVGLLAWVDKPLLFLMEDSASLGFYFAVQRTVVFIGAAGVVITGMVSERFAALSKAEGLRLVTLMERYASLCVVPMTAFYLAFSEQLVETFFGAEYAPHHGLVYPLAVAGLLVALAAPSVTWSASGSRWRRLFAAGAASLATLFAVPAALSWLASGVEPSFAVAIGCMASAAIFYALARLAPAREGAGFHSHLPRHVACAGLMVTVLFWLSGSFASMGFGELVALAVFGVLLYGLLLYLFGEFMQGEWGEFKTLRGV